MTARERTVIRAVIRALEGGDRGTIDALSTSYGIPYSANKPRANRVAELLKALCDDNS